MILVNKYLDKFGAQTTSVPDDNYFIEGKGSALYKLDDLTTTSPFSKPQILKVHKVHLTSEKKEINW